MEWLTATWTTKCGCVVVFDTKNEKNLLILELEIWLDLRWSVINLFLELKILDSWSKLKIKLVHF